MSHIELVIWVILIKSHHLIFLSICFIRFFSLVTKLLLLHLIHSLILRQGAPCEVCLVHLHWMGARWHHINEHSWPTAIVWGSSSVWHSSNECLALQCHSHLAHLLKIYCYRVHLLIYHIINANLRFSTTLLRSHW